MNSNDKGIRYFKCPYCDNWWDEIHSDHRSKTKDYCPECNGLVSPYRSEGIK